MLFHCATISVRPLSPQPNSGLPEFGTVGVIKPACLVGRGHNPAATIPPSWREAAVAALISLAPRIRARTKAANEPSTVNPRVGPIGPAA
jgi:hypothetical protein